MIESFSEANDELQRIEHLVFTSLKYTRTVDVIVNIVNRMISCIDFLIDAYMKYAIKNKMIEEEIPKNQALKAELLKKTFSESDKVVEMAEFYLWLRKIIRAKHDKEKEFKRGVALLTEVKNAKGSLEKVKLDIDKMEEIYYKIKEYRSMTFEIIKTEKIPK